MEQKKFITSKDLPFFTLLLALLGALLLWLALAPPATVAIVEQNGEQVLTRSLSQLTQPEELVLEGENGITLTVTLTARGAAITASTCPDQTCVRTGTLRKAGETALCLPARVALRLEGTDHSDAVTY